MRIRLGPVDLFLESQHEAVREGWRTLLGSDGAPPATAAIASVRLQLSLAQTLPALAEVQRIYVDPNQIVDIYRSAQDGATIMHFRQGALVWLWPGARQNARGVVTPPIFQHGHLEDVTFAALAPLLRRHALYLIHAAAVRVDQAAVLLVGPSHSGKTTTGLALVLNGGRHLASDVTALSLHDGRVIAHPTAGTPRIRPGALELLPSLQRLAEKPIDAVMRIDIRAKAWGSAAPVAALLFPTIATNGQSSLERLPESIALARLMEESIDRWDSDVLPDHMDFLAALTSQARHFRLHLAPHIEQLVHLIEDAL